MRLEGVTAEIRPRSDWEAVDLGFAMVRRDFWRCFSVWWLAVIVPTVAAGWLLWNMPLLLLVLFWWWKPAGSRMVLFEISRRLFGEKPSWKSVWREIPGAWCRRFFHRFVWVRFSPWLPVTLAVEDLERLKGNAYRQRCNQVTRRGEGVVMWLYFLADTAAVWLGLGVLAVVLMFLPEGQDSSWQLAWEMWNIGEPFQVPLLIQRMVVLCMMLAMSLTDVFVTGAGFGAYINNRTWIEGWDVELAFRRLAARIGKVAAAVALVLCFLPAGVVAREPSEAIGEVLSDGAFEVHSVTQKIPVPKSGAWDWLSGMLGAFEMLGGLFLIGVAGVLLGLIAWLVWKFRHVFFFRARGGGNAMEHRPSARVVMGMEVSAASLPPDVPGSAWGLWQQGRWQEAMALLYRGAIAGVMEAGRVRIEESDTEGDCLRRVVEAGERAHPGYFRGLTDAWIRLAYAGSRPEDGEMRALCDGWPFVGRRAK